MPRASQVKEPPLLSNCPLRVTNHIGDATKQANANEKSILMVEGEKELKTVTKKVLTAEE